MTDFDFIKDEELEALAGGVNSDIITSEEEISEVAYGRSVCCNGNGPANPSQEA